MVILAWCTGIPSIVILSTNIRLWHSTTRDTDTMSRPPPPTDLPPNVREPSSSRLHAAMTKVILIKSRITTCSLTSVRPTLLATLNTRLPTRSLTLNTYLFLTRLASPRHATSRVPDVAPTTLDLPEMYGRLYSCRLQNRGFKNSNAYLKLET